MTATMLPNELWRHIFLFLSASQLKTVRLVCPAWNLIVRSSPKLLDKFRLTIPGRSSIQQLQQVASGRYPNVKTRNLCRGTVKAVQPLLSHVRDLTLDGPWITARRTVRVLSSMPNLEQLRLIPDGDFDYELYERMPTGVVLNRLEKLGLDIGDKDEFLSILQRICPKLKSLELSTVIQRYLDSDYGSKLLEFVRSNRSTLKELKFKTIEFREESLLRDIVSMEGLELVTVSLYHCNAYNSDIIHLCQSQAGLEILYLSFHSTVSNDVLTAIAMNLSNLKSLQLKTDIVNLLPILRNLPRLERLFLMYGSTHNEFLDLSAYANPNLHMLTLKRFFTTSTSLLGLFRKSPNIRNLTLYNCPSVSVRDILVIAGQLNHLQELSVKRLPPTSSCPDHFADFAFTPLRALRRLKLTAKLPSHVLSAFLEKCPSLESLYLSCTEFDDNDILKLLRFMRNIVELTLDKLPAVSSRSARYVVSQCKRLEIFRITDCANLVDFKVPQRSAVQQ